MKITTAQYAKSLYEMTDGKSQQEVDIVVANFFKLLRKNRKMKIAGKIITKFSEIYNKENGVVDAEIITRSGIGHAVSGKVLKFVKEKYSAKDVILDNKTDADLKGGMIIRVGDEIFDGSVSRQLKELKNNLTK